MGLIEKILAIVFGGSAAVTAPLLTPPVALDEILTFECAKHVVELIPEKRQTGPVFHRDGLVFTSINSASGEKILIVNAGSGTFSIPLHGIGVNRVRFSIPATLQAHMTSYYLAYLHGGSQSSRYYEFSSGKAPAGKDDIDYTTVHPRRAEPLLPHLEYAIYETIENTLNMITRKKLDRHELGLLKAESCDHISRKSPTLARNIRYDLDVISAILKGPAVRMVSGGGRLPASASSRRSLK